MRRCGLGSLYKYTSVLIAATKGNSLRLGS